MKRRKKRQQLVMQRTEEKKKQRQWQPHRAKKGSKRRRRRNHGPHTRKKNDQKTKRRNVFETWARRSKSASEKKKRTARQEKIQKILEELKGTKNISNIKSAKKRILIPKVKNRKGEVIVTWKGIANVFAEFDTKLYEDGEDEEITRKNEAEVCSESKRNMPVKFEPIPEFTTGEIQDAMDCLKRGKAGDSSGMRSETDQEL